MDVVLSRMHPFSCKKEMVVNIFMKHTHPRLLNDALSNGLRIVGEVRSESESVAICYAVLAGSRDEGGDVALGTAHALEHMLFKGTRKRSSQHVLEAFTRIGAQINAATFSAATVYHLQVLAEHLEPAFALLVEMIASPLLEEPSWAIERDAILNELAEDEEQPIALVWALLRQAYFGKHALAHSALGTHESLMQLNAAQIHRFWGVHYHPNRMVVSVVGNFDETALRDMIAQYCGAWEPGIPPCYEEPHVRGAGQAISVRYNPRLQLQYFLLGVPALAAGAPGYRAALLGSRVLWMRLYWAIAHKGIGEEHDVDLWATDVDILGNHANLLTLQSIFGERGTHVYAPGMGASLAARSRQGGTGMQEERIYG